MQNHRTEISCLRGIGSSENVAYGMRTARDAILMYIVDDGVADRGHRRTLYAGYTQVGVGSAYYPQVYGTISVNDFL